MPVRVLLPLLQAPPLKVMLRSYRLPRACGEAVPANWQPLVPMPFRLPLASILTIAASVAPAVLAIPV
ncbi:hypothetical protein ACFS07_27270 [Undibacterium arcticum]